MLLSKISGMGGPEVIVWQWGTRDEIHQSSCNLQVE